MQVYDTHDDDDPPGKVPWNTIFSAAVIFIVLALLAFSGAAALVR